MYKKYQKYKLKYLNLKQIGGNDNEWMVKRNNMWIELNPRIDNIDMINDIITTVKSNIDMETYEPGTEHIYEGNINQDIKIVVTYQSVDNPSGNLIIKCEYVIGDKSFELSNTQNKCLDFIKFAVNKEKETNKSLDISTTLKLGNFISTAYKKYIEEFNIYKNKPSRNQVTSYIIQKNLFG